MYGTERNMDSQEYTGMSVPIAYAIAYDSGQAERYRFDASLSAQRVVSGNRYLVRQRST